MSRSISKREVSDRGRSTLLPDERGMVRDAYENVQCSNKGMDRGEELPFDAAFEKEKDI